MRDCFTIVVLAVTFSCTYRNQTVDSGILGDSVVLQESNSEYEYRPEFPLTNFSVDDQTSTDDRRKNYFPANVTDLTIAQTSEIVVSFDHYGSVSCEWRGQLAITRDTIYLEYYEFCDHEGELVNESAELRFYFEIKDQPEFKRKIFAPRQVIRG